MASTAKSKHIMSPRRRMSLQQRRSRRRHRKYTESLDDSNSSISSDHRYYERPTCPIQLIQERYYNIHCKCCRELAKLKLEPQSDDDEYASPDEDFYGDEELRLRVIHYRRERWMTGCFDVGCYPNLPSFSGCFHRDHLHRLFTNFDRLMKVCVELVFKQYRQVEKKELVFLRYLNATAERGGCVLLFFLTFECYNPLAENYVDICQAMVTVYMNRLHKPQVNLFRRVTNDDEDEDLLPVNENHAYYTKGRRPRRLDTWRDVHHQKGLF
ncbi:hypothetical protein LINGRAHAP2_LOCUS36532 [Linum grandiflorum]